MSEQPDDTLAFVVGESMFHHIDDLIERRVVDPPRQPEPLAFTIRFEWNWTCGGLGVTWVLSRRSRIYSVALHLVFITASIEYA